MLYVSNIKPINYPKTPNPTFKGLFSIRAALAISHSAKSVLSPRSQELLEQFAKQYDFARKKPIQWGIKRAIDIVGASLGIAATTPIVLCSAVLVKLDSKGPAFFKQKRVGRMGREFTIYKLRTMFPNSGENPAQINDPRVTKVGRYLRRFSIDELPQFWNILKGDMSLVGPRPLILSENQGLEEVDLNGIRRLVVKPGASLNYKRGNGYKRKIEEEKRYLDHWNLAADMRQLLHICRKVLTGANQ